MAGRPFEDMSSPAADLLEGAEQMERSLRDRLRSIIQ